MTVPNGINDRIALARGWTFHEWYEEGGVPGSRREAPLHTHWRNPSRQIAMRPDFVGTLEGVAGMLKELGPEWDWGWTGIEYDCSRGLNCGPDEYFCSPEDRPGDCVGEAWLSIFEKEG